MLNRARLGTEVPRLRFLEGHVHNTGQELEANHDPKDKVNL